MRGTSLCLVAWILLVTFVVLTDAGCSYHSRLTKKTVPRVKRQAVTCDAASKYRRADGQCNNVVAGQEDWGSAGIPFLRHDDAPAVYNDNIGFPRILASDGSDLPNPRDISNTVHRDLEFISRAHSTMVMQWGQFIDHDITLTPKTQDAAGADIDCCSATDSVFTDSSHPCFRVDVPSGDGYYDDGKCINLVRSEAYAGTGTDDSNKREQYNAVSAFIDGSMIYGTSDDEMNALRDTSSGTGQLLVHNTNFLPEGDIGDCHYDAAEPNYYCFKAGDPRVNAFFGLQAMQTVFMREHNRLATELSAINTGWDDETLFQEARRIVIAELQVITYGDWASLLFDDNHLDTYQLREGSYSYDSSINPSFYNVFSTAAFRFGHSMIPDNFTINGTTYETHELFQETKYVIDGLREVVEGLIDRDEERADAWYVDSMRNKLDETNSTTKDGTDIVALNIQRGRDHGLPPYNTWRVHCGLTQITGFTPNQGSDFGIIQARDLRTVYASVNDIDLYSGGIAEAPSTNAAIGPLYQCLIGETLKNLRDGDRLWWESDDATTGFTAAQRTELSEVTLSKIFCDNLGYADDDLMKTNVFRAGGARRECSRHNNDIDLTLWQE